MGCVLVIVSFRERCSRILVRVCWTTPGVDTTVPCLPPDKLAVESLTRLSDLVATKV